ncbi:MAG: FAD-dependent oxidoreductase [Steroidobacteraceae bacterium]
MASGGIARDARIVIVGAGAAGLCTAWYLKQAGFYNVKVLERSPRLGGKCRSLTVNGQSFDLGANYITSAYTRVRELAAHVGATMYTEKPGHAINAKSGHVRSILAEVLKNTTLFTLAGQAIRYLWKRWRIRHLLTPYRPGFGHVQEHPELKGSFADWLDRNGLADLHQMVEVPLTLMGYGKLENIPAAYALTYMSPKTFKDLGLFAANFPLRGWPKRFTQGYGRMFERLAAEVNVLTGVKNLRIERGASIRVDYDVQVQQLERKIEEHETEYFDYLVVACPQVLEVVEPFLDLDPVERRLFGQVVYNPFYVTTYTAPGTREISAVTFSMNDPQVGHPYVVTRQYPENDFISVYSRGDRAQSIGRPEILENNRRFLAAITDKDPTAHPSLCDDWAYFPHVPVDVFDAGFYGELEALQGQRRTFYTGGLLAFELVETIAEYSHGLVQQHFVGRGNA